MAQQEVSAMTTKAKVLTRYLENQTAAFDWKTHNCAHFAGGYVQLAEGHDPLEDMAMAMTETGTHKLIKRRGGMAQMITGQMARPSISARFAQIGDLVLVPISAENEEAFSIGLCCGECAAVLGIDGSMQMVSMRTVQLAWRVHA
jgi:hypothetical protein